MPKETMHIFKIAYFLKYLLLLLKEGQISKDLSCENVHVEIFICTSSTCTGLSCPTSAVYM